MFELGGIRSQLQQQLADARAVGSRASTEQWVGLVGSCQEVLNVVSALQTVALAHVAACDEVALEDGTVVEEFRGLGHQRLDAPALVDDLLGLSAAGASDRMATAVDLVTRHQQLLQEMASGRLDAYRAGVVAAELGEADPDVCHQVDSVVVGRLRTTGGAEAAGPLRRRARRELERVDPELVRRTAERARGERSLCRSAWSPGVDEWSATLPVEQSRSAWSVVDGLARSYVTEGRCPGIEAARADALMDLILARATGRVALQLTVPVSEVARHAVDPAAASAGGLPGVEDDALVPVTGFGMPGVTHVRASWLASLPGAPPPSRPRGVRGQASAHRGPAATDRAVTDRAATDRAATDRAVTDRAATDRAATDSAATDSAVTDRAATDAAAAPVADPPTPAGAPVADPPPPQASVSVLACDDVTGALASLPVGHEVSPTSDAYRPPAWMIAFVRARDGGCRFPGCFVNARSCDIDHVRAWPRGATHPSNLVCLCRRHHRIKQRPGWSVTARPDGVLSWVDPTGRLRTTHPTDHLHAASAASRARVSATRSNAPTPALSMTAPAPVPAAALPSLLEDQVAHDIERGLVALACRADTISVRNSRALRRGERIRTSDVAARAAVHSAHKTPRIKERPPRSRDDDPPF